MPPEDRTIFIVGSEGSRDHFLAESIRQRTGLRCLRLRDRPELLGARASRPPGRILVLKDCRGLAPATIVSDVRDIAACLAPDLLALLNVPRGKEIERQLCCRGVRGFFYEGDSPEMIARGVVALFAGEFWVSRKVAGTLLSAECDRRFIL